MSDLERSAKDFLKQYVSMLTQNAQLRTQGGRTRQV